ncbi:MAG TPA: polyketide synthase, partial [Solirubrobacterales bacterium]|nr:polyketide synthase [Solirubrobacterales bacterium]
MSVQAEGAGGLSPVKRALLALEEMRARLEAVEGARREPIAITGIGCRFPGGAQDPAAFWRLLREGGDAIREVPRERWDAEAIYSPDPGVRGKTNARWGGFLDEVDRFDPAFFGISPREATHMDPQQRLVLEVAWEALEDAGVAAERVAGSQTGVFLGIYNNDYAWLQGRGLDEVDTYSATGAGQGIAANRVSYLLDLRGPSLSVDTTCSSSLVAVHLACQSLRSGECRMALAGGVNLILSPLIALSVSKVVPMAADGRCKTFDAGADGIVRGEGCGIVVLKRLADALADRDEVIAVIRGTAANQDGHSNGFTAPSGAAQQAVIRQALRDAGLSASDITYVEAHGTGTPLGDPIELEALDAVFGGRRTPAGPCVVGSVKTNLGHLEA